jgi:acyl-CoA synthetase (AMP-forming)/AMP-acid ligase II
MLDFINNFKGNFLIDRELKVYTYDDLKQSIIDNSDEYKIIKPGAKVILRSDYSFKAISIFLYLAELGCNICPITSDNDSDLNEKLILFNGDYLIDSKLNYDLIVLENDKFSNDESKFNSNITLFSSGTSGKPKMMVQNLNRIFESHDVPKTQKQLKILVFLLFDHIGGLNTLISSIKKGMCLAITSSRNPDDIINFISEARINILPTTPTFLNMLLLSDAFTSEKFNSIKLITYGTEKMPPGTLKRINVLLPNVKLLQTFGTSETGIVKTISKSSDSLFFKIIDTDYKVVNDELFLKTRTQIKNYEGLNSESFTNDGWFKTGDIVEVDLDGFIKIISRKNNIINVGGLKVFPNEIEQLIYELDFIIDATVFSEPNAIVGNIVCLKVIVERNTDAIYAKKQIKLICRSRLEKYKIPQKIIVTNEVSATQRFKKSLE